MKSPVAALEEAVPDMPDGLPDDASRADWLVGGGVMGDVVRAKDWSKTPLGPIGHWPQSLRTTVSLCLSSNFPISIAWGPQRTQIYNDGYWPICGAKHPHSMGQDFKECWLSAWPAIGEAFERATVGETRFLVNERMFLDRNGYLEETFFTFSFSPIRDESGDVGGLFHPVTELTQQTLAERRLKVLRDVADRTTDAHSVNEATRLIAAALAEHDLDLPFALLYLIDPEAKSARLAASAGLDAGTDASPDIVALTDQSASSWPLADAAQSRQIRQVDDVEARFASLRCGPYPEPPKTALVLPICLAGLEHTFAILIAGVSPRRPLDDPYRTFYVLLGNAVTNALTGARAYEEEKRRAEKLAELDRAKTAFFSNVSHEFRTPLTLMLGPLEGALRRSSLSEADREELTVVHRNGLRLLKLVNSLLDFSRVEASRVQAHHLATDLARVTADLASTFRSACERAGLSLSVDCPPLPEPVHVDRDMWEKIVLNLVSNAFKFTFEGGITVAIRAAGPCAELTVRDTGTGIPEDELPRIFERFHRVENARGRTHEGTGIGLALVQELVRLHGGTVDAASTHGEGTAFTVRIPFGIAHLPSERIGGTRSQASTATRADAYVQEALRWLPSGGDGPGIDARDETITASAPVDGVRARVLLADDNADMRDYVRRLLSGRFDIEAVADGRAALAAARAERPDLVLIDVMMPHLDGFGLLKAMRAEPDLRDVPVIMLSARAGEEARVEGIEAGADDYLIKPFSARELLARVQTHLDMAKLRRQAERRERELRMRFETVIEHLPIGAGLFDPAGRVVLMNPAFRRYVPGAVLPSADTAGAGGEWIAFDPDGRRLERSDYPGARALQGEVVDDVEFLYRDPEGTEHWTRVSAIPIRDPDGEITGALVVIIDITDRKRIEEHLKLVADELNHRVKNTLATVQAITAQALRGATAGADAQEAIESRLIALSKSHDLLTRESWEGVGLRDVALQALQPFGLGRDRADRFAIGGTDIRLRPKVALALGMVFHELATNAVKYGALSAEAGRVAIAWTVEDARLVLTWAESGGPPARPPSRKGFGSRLIERGVVHELDGAVRLDYMPDGVVCEINIPVPRGGQKP